VSALRNVGAILQKEWRHYFGSPIAYVALVMWTFVFGFFFVRLALTLSAASMNPGMGGGKLSINEGLSWLLNQVGVVALFVLPMLTMRLFAEEKRQGTIELLATAPITDTQIVLGKFLGALALYALMLFSGFLNLIFVWRLSTPTPEWRPLATAALGLLLLGGAFIALGMFISSLTRNQVAAGAGTFGLFLVLWILGWFDDPSAGRWFQALGYLSLSAHLDEMMKGVIDLKDVVFYLSFIAAGIFLTQRALESQRWRA
jgi:ABC-2 type transport system permease protein